MSEIADSKRIAKNTLFLYARMLLIMLVGLYTVRLVLDILGAEDYGIYNVVGGVLAMFSFLTNSMVSASQRYFAYYIGKGDEEKLSQYFVTTGLCYFLVGIVVVILAETVGLWFVLHKLTIPTTRMDAAIVVYQCSIFNFVLRLFVIPHQSFIIAKERMNVYAYVSIVEIVLQLLIVFLLKCIDADQLIVYGLFHCLTAIIISSCYILYSKVHFKETKLYLYFNKNQFLDLLGYSTWNLIGVFSSVCRSQGINILLNMFFTPAINAARAVAYQINSAVSTFAHNFFSAVKPQITKQYAAGEHNSMMNLVFRSSRYCYYILYILALPILLEVPFLLELWLKKVPDYTVLFTRLVIINALIDSTAHPLMTAIQATGRIRTYQIVTAGFLLLNLPISYIFLRMGFPPQSTMIISICISVFAQISRVFFARNMLNMSVVDYIKNVICPIIAVTLCSVVVPLGVFLLFDTSAMSVILIVLSACLSVGGCVLFLGMKSAERVFLLNFVKTKFVKNECTIQS
ncbi:MAG: lipopolysaccharide biosynthesis protein [Bacteroidales bacterium]|nr:lipopolysaccharide biosynthesis protein [Bacteroidales bacterium]MBR4498046.1 lipopolysaccharide biosynthesis protein [Bacteroidales bacterium]